MKPHLLTVLLLALLALLACPGVSPGANPKLDENALAGMRKGQSTFDDIVRRFGRPDFGSTNWDGTRTAAYAYGDGRSPAALSALGAVMGGSSANTVVLHFNDKGVLTDYTINHAAVKNGDSPAAPAARYVEPAFGGSAPTPAAKPASAANPGQAAAAAKPASGPAAAQTEKPEQRGDGLPWWLPSTSTREDRY